MVGDAIALVARKEVRVSVLGYIQRGGSPSPYDRILATRFGVGAVELIAAGGFGKMVCLQQESIRAVHDCRRGGKDEDRRPEGRDCARGTRDRHRVRGLRGRARIELIALASSARTQDSDCRS